MSKKNVVCSSKSKLMFSKITPCLILIGILLPIHAVFFGLQAQDSSELAEYSFKVRVLVAQEISGVTIKVKLTRIDGSTVAARELGYEGTAIFDRLTPGQYVVTIERENQATVARPLDIKVTSTKTILWEIRLSGDSTTVRESTKNSFQKAATTPDELFSPVSRKAFKAFQQASEESARGNYSKAVEYLEKAIKESPNFFEAYNNLGAQFQKLKEVEKAIEAYKQAIEINRTSLKPFLNLGNLYLERGDIDSALKNYQSVLELDDSNVVAHLALGKIYIEKHDFRRAEEQLETVTRLNPSQNRQAFVGLIRMEILAKRYEKAKYFLNSFRLYFPSDPEVAKLQQVIDQQSSP